MTSLRDSTMKNIIIIFRIPTLIALSIFLIATTVQADTQSVTVNVTFVVPVSITKSADMSFGLIDEILNLEVITLDTADGISGTGSALQFGLAAEAADLRVTADAGDGITISIGSIVNGTGYALSAFTCKWAGLAEASCATPLNIAGGNVDGSAQILLIGATLSGDNAAVVGAANGSFVATVVYQ
jgi:hypothetical protein